MRILWKTLTSNPTLTSSVFDDAQFFLQTNNFFTNFMTNFNVLNDTDMWTHTIAQLSMAKEPAQTVHGGLKTSVIYHFLSKVTTYVATSITCQNDNIYDYINASGALVPRSKRTIIYDNKCTRGIVQPESCENAKRIVLPLWRNPTRISCCF